MSFQLILYIYSEFIKHAKYLNYIKKITRCLFVIMLMVKSEAFSRVSKSILLCAPERFNCVPESLTWVTILQGVLSMGRTSPLPWLFICCNHTVCHGVTQISEDPWGLIKNICFISQLMVKLNPISVWLFFCSCWNILMDADLWCKIPL